MARHLQTSARPASSPSSGRMLSGSARSAMIGPPQPCLVPPVAPNTPVVVRCERLHLKSLVPFSLRETTSILTEMLHALANLSYNAPTRLECLICSDNYMECLNRDFLNTPGPTNTLAFEADAVFSDFSARFPSGMLGKLSKTTEAGETPTGKMTDDKSLDLGALTFPSTAPGCGQIYFCAGQYARELILYGQDPEEYAVFLLAHALTHTAGLDHGLEMDRISSQLVLAGMECVHRLNPNKQPQFTNIKDVLN